MKNKTIYRHKISQGAKKKMLSIVKYSDSSSALVDGAFCLITITDINPFDSVLNTIDQSKSLYQVKIYGNNSDQEALIYSELLELQPEEDWIFESV